MDELIKYKLLMYFFMFVLGGLSAFIVIFNFSKVKVGEYLIHLKNKIKRFIYNIMNQFSIVVVFIILYILFKIIKYETDMLPNLIGAILSVFIIDFLIEERELNSKRDLSELLNYKIKEISMISNKLLLKYIDFEDYDSNDISKLLLQNIISKQDLLHDTVPVTYIVETGKICKDKVVKIDYPFYIARELKPLVTQLIFNYSKYLDHSQIVVLIELDEILDKNIFKAKISLIEGIEDSDIIHYTNSLIEVLDRFNNIVKKLEVRS